MFKINKLFLFSIVLVYPLVVNAGAGAWRNNCVTTLNAHNPPITGASQTKICDGIATAYTECQKKAERIVQLWKKAGVTKKLNLEPCEKQAKGMLTPYYAGVPENIKKSWWWV